MPSVPGTINYPTSLDDVISLIEANNNASSTLTAPIGASDLLIPVANAAAYSNSGILTLVDDLIAFTKIELVIYTSKSGNNLVVPTGGRGAFGTTAQSWLIGHFVETRNISQIPNTHALAIIAAQTKIGYGASTPGGSAQALVSDAAGQSTWRAIAQGDISGLTVALAAKAPLASPALTGNATAPTPAGADSSTKIATTAFVQGEIAPKAPLASPALTGTPTAPTAVGSTSSTQIATTAFTAQALANYAPAVDPQTFRGLVLLLDANQPNKAPTVIAGDTFNRGDNASSMGTTDTGSKTWTTVTGTMGISSNAAYASALDGSNQGIATISTGSQDGLFEVDVVCESTGASGILMRVADASNYLAVVLNNASVRVIKRVAGSSTTLATFSTSRTVGTTYRLRASISGQAISVAVDDLSQGEYALTSGEQSAFTATAHGIFVGTTTERLNNYSAETGLNKLGLAMYGWEDLAGQGWSTFETDPLYRPRLLTSGGNPVASQQFAGNMWIAHPPINTGELTIICVGKNQGSLSSDQRVVSVGSPTYHGSTGSLQWLNSQITPYDTNPWYTGINAPSSEDHIFGLIASSSGFPGGLGTGVKAFGDRGHVVFRRMGALTSATNWGALQVFRSNLFNRGAGQGADDMVGYLRCVVVYNRAITEAELASLKAWLIARYNLSPDIYPTYNIVFDGDSLTTSGLGTAVIAGGSYPDRVVNALTGKCRAWNVAVYAQTISGMSSDAAAQIDPLYNPAISKNACIVWGGTNDMANTPSNPTAAFNALKSYCQARQAAGWKVIVLTCLPRGTAGQFETDRQAFNTSIRGDSSFYHALADVAANTTIGDNGDQNDTTYYQGDKIHLTSAGYGVVAPIVSAALALV